MDFSRIYVVRTGGFLLPAPAKNKEAASYNSCRFWGTALRTITLIDVCYPFVSQL